ncbi:MAG: 3-oxoadipate CoA-transferase subunit A, partial [uncultured Solirubrobacteraceae bacterium]
ECAVRTPRPRGRHGPPRPRRDVRGPRGFHAPHPVRRGPRAHPPGPPRADARAHDAGPGLRPDDRHGLRHPADLLLRGQPRRGLAAPLPRRGRARVARAAGARGALPRRHGDGLPRGRRRPALRRPARLRGNGPREDQPRGGVRGLPVHGREAQRGPRGASRRHRGPRPARRLARQRPALGPVGRAEGGGARRRHGDRDGRGGRRRAHAHAERGGAARVDARRRLPRARRGAPVLRGGLLHPRQRLLLGVGRDLPRPRPLRRVDARARPACGGSAGM